MYRPWPAFLLVTLFFFLCNPRLLSASPITPDDTVNGLYPTDPPPSTNPTTITNLTALHPIHCLPERDPRRPPPSPSDCIDAIYGDLLIPEPPTTIHKFYDWSYTRGTADFILPAEGTWSYRTCVVVVRNEDPERVGSFSLDEVGITANDVVTDCVGEEDGTPPRQGKHKGGLSKVGSPIKGFYVEVYGVPYRPMTKNGTGQTETVDATVQRVPVPDHRGVDVTS